MRQNRDPGGADLGQIGADKDPAHPFDLCRGTVVDAGDAGMGMGAAHERHMHHAGQDDVIDIAPLPGQKADILDPSALMLAECGHDAISPVR